MRVFNSLKCKSLPSNMVENDQAVEFRKTYETQSLFYGDNTMLETSVDLENYEDIALPGGSSVTAINFNDGTTITYSRYSDYYQYRILERYLDEESGKTIWLETNHGPVLNRKVDKVFVCTGLHYIHINTKTTNLVVVSLRGLDYLDTSL